jgi:hypothetical protein
MMTPSDGAKETRATEGTISDGKSRRNNELSSFNYSFSSLAAWQDQTSGLPEQQAAEAFL